MSHSFSIIYGNSFQLVQLLPCLQKFTFWLHNISDIYGNVNNIYSQFTEYWKIPEEKQIIELSAGWIREIIYETGFYTAVKTKKAVNSNNTGNDVYFLLRN